jgi:hypothetical protein
LRRDGFDGEIDLAMTDLPEGVTSNGLKIAAGQSRGVMLVSASQNAPRAVGNATFLGRATINGKEVTHSCRLASMAWPILDSWSEIPHPRLLADVPVSVSGFEFAPLTIAPPVDVIQTVTAGGKLTIPLFHTRRCEFSGASMQMKTMGAGFERVPAFSVSLTAEESQAVIDTAALKTPPGDYRIAFYGAAVAKHKPQPAANVADAKTAAAPKDIVDIVVSEPITIRVLPVEKK